jgi:transposase, IS5 family
LQLQLFEVESYNSVFHQNFLQSDLGRLFTTIPFREMADFFRSKIKRCPQGVPPTFSIEGGLGLMFLKHQSNLSDAALIERINTDWHYQMFCGLSPRIHYGIKDKDMVGRWRRFFGMRLDIKKIQEILAYNWKGDLPQPHICMCDATVYDSHIKYPTDVKLLWDCVEWLRGEMVLLCRREGWSVPRSKYKEQKMKYLEFAKRRKKTRKQERRRRSSLLYLLDKMQAQYQGLLNRGGKEVVSKIKPAVFARLKTVRTILTQQRYHFGQPDKSVPNRIVSLYKPYLRPIVRGKENKPVEFGAKVHQMQIGGCNFIEHLDFEAFHEGNRLKKTVQHHQHLFGQVKQIAADGIYATNRNRKWCRQNNIHTSFVPKGRQGPKKEQADTLRAALSNARSTRLEGSFGNEKNHYLLRKIRARTQETEVTWIFFGVHTANAVKVAKSRQAKQNEEKAAKAAA